MAQRYVIELTDKKKRKFLEELLAQLDFLKVETTIKKKPTKKTPNEERFMKGLKGAVKEMKDDIAGKRKMQSARDFVDELRR